MEGLNDYLMDLGQDYETAEGAGEILDELNNLIENNAGIDFLNALCLVKRTTKSASSWLRALNYAQESPEIDIDAGNRYDYLKQDIRRLKLALFELTESSRKLAQALYQSDDMERSLFLEARKAWEKPRDGLIVRE